MNTARLEAFSDGVLSIVITIMVLTLSIPESGEFKSLENLVPVFTSYIVSFIYLGIYWINHHHILKLIKKVNSIILWANLHLLFWLSLIPFSTGWVGNSGFSQDALALYGGVLLGSSCAFSILIYFTKRYNVNKEVIEVSLKGQRKKSTWSMVAFLSAIFLAYVSVWLSISIYVCIASIWFLPNKAIENYMEENE